MANVIILIISLAFLALLSTAGMYYFGGDVSDKKIEAEASKLRNEASQIAAAVKLYRGQGNEFNADFRLEKLVDMGYLSSLPADWEPGTDQIVHVLEDEEKAEAVCFVANRQSQFVFDASEVDVVPYSKDPNFAIPLCSKENLNPMVPCCSNGS